MLKLATLIALAFVALLLAAACGGGGEPTATRSSTTPSPTAEATGGGGDEGVEAGLLRLTFDGESCTYEGPTDLTAGPVALVFLNESEGRAAVNLMRHRLDKTIQDLINYIGEEPSTKHAPSWTREVGTWNPIPAGESDRWEGDLEPGIHTMVCAGLGPLLVWFGTGLTVEDSSDRD